MYQWKPVTDRMISLRNRTRDRVIRHESEWAVLYTEADKQLGAMLPYLKVAKAWRYVLENCSVRVEDEEMLACTKGAHFCASNNNPLWSGGTGYLNSIESGRWTLGDDGDYHNPEGAGCHMVMSQEDYQKLCEVREYWKGKGLEDIGRASLPSFYKKLQETGGSAMNPFMPLFLLPAGHFTPGFNNLVKKGYGAIEKQAQDWLDEHEYCLMGDDTDKWMFYSSVVECCEGIKANHYNYAKACEAKAAETQDPERKAELLSMAEDLRWIATEAPKHYRQACQMALIYQTYAYLMNVCDVSSFGRFDQYTWPFLKADLESGYITEEYAQEITDCFFLKVNGFWRGGEGEMAKIIGIGNTYLHTTLGGVDPDTGEDATNPVTYMALESVARLKLHDPTISLRINKNTPEELWDSAFEVNRMVGGLPLFQNDEVIIPGIMKELGFTLEDARDYAIIGCQEITGSGNDYACCNGVIPPNTNLHYSVLLDMALNDGINPLNGQQCSQQNRLPVRDGETSRRSRTPGSRPGYTLSCRPSCPSHNYAEEIGTTPPCIRILHLHRGMHGEGPGRHMGRRQVQLLRRHRHRPCDRGRFPVHDQVHVLRQEALHHPRALRRRHGQLGGLRGAAPAHSQRGAPLRQRRPLCRRDDELRSPTTYYEMCHEDLIASAPRTTSAGLYGASDHIGQGHVTWATPDGRNFPSPSPTRSSPARAATRTAPPPS